MNCNKLTSLILLAGVFTSTSCVEEKRPVPVRQRINVTPPSRESEAISQLTASIDDISADLDLFAGEIALQGYRAYEQAVENHPADQRPRCPAGRKAEADSPDPEREDEEDGWHVRREDGDGEPLQGDRLPFGAAEGEE